MKRAKLSDIDHFLSQRRIALVGVSRDEKDFTRLLFRELTGRGYDVVPVNPGAEEAIEDRNAYPRVSAIPEPVDAALIMTAPAQSATVVEDCAAAGVKIVWLHRGAGQGAVSDEAIAAAERHGMTLVAGQCPFMFLPGSGAVHKVHRFFKRLARTYPQAA